MELTWLTILASVTLGLGAVCVFIFAVQRDYFHNIEDAKYQVFWGDLDEEQQDGDGSSQSTEADAGR